MTLLPYLQVKSRWPLRGRVILASFDAASIIVYQAYRPEIARWAVEHQRLGGPHFSFDRMSWVKPNFLWMMYRSGWAAKPGQERVLAIRVRRGAFDAWLAEAVPSSHDPEHHPDASAWRAALAGSQVRLQWDPDHDPCGKPVERRAVQLGLRGARLHAFAHQDTLGIEDVTEQVQTQHRLLQERGENALQVPDERVYEPCRP